MSKKLNEYNKKRDFKKTDEPVGRVEPSANKKKLLFVVQHHMARKEHYDFRLEWNNVLLSWAVPKGPSFNPKDKRLAIHVEDHPISYASFEGTIPQGQYGGGTVMLWDTGTWQPEGNFEEGLKKGSLKFYLSGKRLNGKWALVKIKADKKNNWLLIKDNDKFAQDKSGIESFSTSVKTMRTMQEIEKNFKPAENVSNPFDKVSAKLLSVASTPPQGEDWMFELKYDGYRMLALVQQHDAKLITRNGKITQNILRA